MIDFLDIKTVNASTPVAPVSITPSASSSSSNQVRINDIVIGTEYEWRQRLLPAFAEHNVMPEDVEQRVEDTIEDDSEAVWLTFLAIEPHYRTTNHWLADS